MNISLIFVLVVFLVLISTNNSYATQLRQDYYKQTCPNLESIVRNEVNNKIKETFVTAPATLRLFFHDCFVQGCDASIMLSPSSSPRGNTERDAPDNLSVPHDAYDTVIRAKAAVDKVAGCKHKVSCADILALATRDAIAFSGGPNYAVELGRKDGRRSHITSVENQLPHADFNYKQLQAIFASHGLSQVDLIALSGAHTIGFSHCNQFSKRLYNYNTKTNIDPGLHQGYAKELQRACPRNVDAKTAVPFDPTTPLKFDNHYYKNIVQGKGLLTSDHALLSTKKSKRVVRAFATNGTLFERVFVAAITKLGRVGIKTGNQGEIRRDCRFVN